MGAPILDRADIGPATKAATRSGLCKAGRLGTSSPITKDKYVMTNTTMEIPMLSA